MMRPAFVISASLLLLLTSCEPEYAPKPKAYPRVSFPAKSYQSYVPSACPFSFDIPSYALVKTDSVFFNKKLESSCWLNVEFPDFNGTINLTYKDINDTMSLAKLLEDAHKLSFKHAQKADYIDESVIRNQQGVSGMIYDVGGDAASNFQFYLTDSSRHFLRGALYFNNEPNADSMAPVYQFVREDLDHMISSFHWR